MNVRTRIAKIAAAAVLSATVVGIGSATAGAVAGDSSQWGRDQAAAAVSGENSSQRKVNEYEGQHRKVNEYEGQHRKVNEYEGQHR